MICSAVWLSDSLLASAGHCAEMILTQDEADTYETFGIMPDDTGGRHIPVATFQDWNKTADYESMRDGVIISVDVEDDLMLVRVPSSGAHSHVDLADKDPAAGSRVSICGHPAGLWWSYTEGLVSAVRERKNPAGWITSQIQVSAAGVYFGSSGGGLFNDSGELAGIASSVVGDATHISFFTSARKLAEFIRDTSS